MPKEKIIENNMSKVILVTGGTGLVGKGIEIVSKQENNADDKFIFLSSKDGDMRYVSLKRNHLKKYALTDHEMFHLNVEFLTDRNMLQK